MSAPVRHRPGMGIDTAVNARAALAQQEHVDELEKELEEVSRPDALRRRPFRAHLSPLLRLAARESQRCGAQGDAQSRSSGCRSSALGARSARGHRRGELYAPVCVFRIGTDRCARTHRLPKDCHKTKRHRRGYALVSLLSSRSLARAPSQHEERPCRALASSHNASVLCLFTAFYRS